MKRTLLTIGLLVAICLLIYTNYRSDQQKEKLTILLDESINQNKQLLKAVKPYFELKPILESRNAKIILTNDGVNFQSIYYENGERIK